MKLFKLKSLLSERGYLSAYGSPDEAFMTKLMPISKLNRKLRVGETVWFKTDGRLRDGIYNGPTDDKNVGVDLDGKSLILPYEKVFIEKSMMNKMSEQTGTEIPPATSTTTPPVDPNVTKKLSDLDIEISDLNKKISDWDARMTPFLKHKADAQKRISDLQKEKTRIGGKITESIEENETPIMGQPISSIKWGTRKEKMYGREMLIKYASEFIENVADDINHSGIDEDKKMKVIDLLMDTTKKILIDAVKKGYKTDGNGNEIK